MADSPAARLDEAGIDEFGLFRSRPPGPATLRFCPFSFVRATPSGMYGVAWRMTFLPVAMLREFIELSCKTLFSPDLGLFSLTADQRMYPNVTSVRACVMVFHALYPTQHTVLRE